MNSDIAPRQILDNLRSESHSPLRARDLYNFHREVRVRFLNGRIPIQALLCSLPDEERRGDEGADMDKHADKDVDKHANKDVDKDGDKHADKDAGRVLRPILAMVQSNRIFPVLTVIVDPTQATIHPIFLL
jgi:hypothetical protein